MSQRDIADPLPDPPDSGPPTPGQSAAPARGMPRLGLLRELSDESVLDVVFAAGAVTRAEIARRTGISKPTVNEAVRRLERAGLLRPAGNETGRPGRVATFYELAPDVGFVVAVDLNPSGVRLTVADLSGTTITEAGFPPPSDQAGVADLLRRAVADAVDRGQVRNGRLRAVGVSVANSVDPANGAVVALPDTPYPQGLIQPAAVLTGLGNVPVLVENDVNLAALAEGAHGAGRGVASFAYLYVGDGLGTGLVVGGHLVRGARGVAGEIGYLPLGFDTRDHARHGLARAVSGRGFAARTRRGTQQDAVAAARAVFDRAARGDLSALAVIEAEGQLIGEAAAAVCAVIDPEVVILGGPIGLEPRLIVHTQETVNQLAPLPTPVRPGQLGDTAALRGALVMALCRARTDLWAHANSNPTRLLT